MNKNLKFAFYGLVGIFGLLAVFILFISLTFNPNDYKPLLVKLVQEKKQRILTINGDIKLTYWPKIGADLGEIRLSEHNNEREFASIQSAKVSLSLIPLLHKELVVDTIYVDGVNVNIEKFADGTTNFDDLMSNNKEEQSQIKFDIDGIDISNSSIRFKEDKSNAIYQIKNFNLKTGHVALNKPFDVHTSFEAVSNEPKASARFELSGGFLADPESGTFGIKNLDAKVKGDFDSIKSADISLSGDMNAVSKHSEISLANLKVTLSGNKDGQVLNADITTPDISLKNQEIEAKQIEMNFSQKKDSDSTQAKVTMSEIAGKTADFQIPKLSIEVNSIKGSMEITGKFASEFSGNLDKLVFDLSKLVGNIHLKDPSMPNGNIDASLTMKLDADIRKQSISSVFDVSFDGSKVKGNLGLTQFDKPFLRFNIDIDKLDTDKFITKSSKDDKGQAKPDSNAKIDLSALKALNADGELRIGWLKCSNIKANTVDLKLKADGGLVELAPLSTNLYEGTSSGSIMLDARNTPVIEIKQTIKSVSIGPLIQDAINNEMLSGKGNVNLDIKTQGSSIQALKKQLNGSASINLADGSVKGIDIAGKLRSVKDKLNVLKQDKVESDKTQKTDFSEMSASFNIKDGVAHNEDLSMKAPLFRIAGSGDIDIGNSEINYLAKPTVVATLKGQGGSDLSQLNGLTIPIKLSGPFDKIVYALDYSSLLEGMAKNKVLDKIGGSKGAAIKSLLGAGNNSGSSSKNANDNQAGSNQSDTLGNNTKKKLNKLLGF